MALEKKFVKEGIRNRDLEDFLTSEFDRAGYSHSIIQRTPLSIRITVFANKPGLIIGRGGKNIEYITNILKDRFGFENPQLDVQEIENPDLDAHVIAKWIASSIERGLNYKRVANIAIERVMNAGAAGVALRISGKLGGDMGRTEKFSAGYLKYSGEPAESMVDTSYSKANVKLGMIGIQVRVMGETPRELEISQMVSRGAAQEAEIETAQDAEKPQETTDAKEETVEAKSKEAEDKPKKAQKKKETKKEVEKDGDNKEEANEGNE